MLHILADRLKWAFSSRALLLTLDMHSSQRVESFFAKLKERLPRVGNLQQLKEAVNSITAEDSRELAAQQLKVNYKAPVSSLPHLDTVHTTC
jgi:hypothetical protein